MFKSIDKQGKKLLQRPASLEMGVNQDLARIDVRPQHLFQSVLAGFLGEGHFSRHVRKMRQTYGERRDVLVNCIAGSAGACSTV
jgi:DNA-binding transcriptional MocR family regulator